MKKIPGLIIVCVIVLMVTVSAFAASAIKIVINGKDANSSVPPTMENGSVMVPLRFVSEQLGLDVKWDGQTKTAKINNKQEGIIGSVILADEVVANEEESLDLTGVNSKSYEIGNHEVLFYATFDNVNNGQHTIKVVFLNPDGDEIALKTEPIDLKLKILVRLFFIIWIL